MSVHVPVHDEAAVLPAWDLVRFGDGWHDAEGDGDNTWRWMKKSSQTMLPTAGARGRLTLRLYVPVDALPVPPAIDVEFNGALVERFIAAKPEIEKTWVLASRQGAANELLEDIDRTCPSECPTDTKRGVGDDRKPTHEVFDLTLPVGLATRRVSRADVKSFAG